MAVLWFIIIIQFGLIGWLAYRNFKPQTVDYWKRAEDMIARWKNSEKDNWEIDFKQAQGIIEKPKPKKIPHDLVRIEKTGSASLRWRCTCGDTGIGYTAWGVNQDFSEHVASSRLVESFITD